MRLLDGLLSVLSLCAIADVAACPAAGSDPDKPGMPIEAGCKGNTMGGEGAAEAVENRSTFARDMWETRYHVAWSAQLPVISAGEAVAMGACGPAVALSPKDAQALDELGATVLDRFSAQPIDTRCVTLINLIYLVILALCIQLKHMRTLTPSKPDFVANHVGGDGLEIT
jgi:hypothetical protein